MLNPLAFLLTLICRFCVMEMEKGAVLGLVWLTLTRKVPSLCPARFVIAVTASISPWNHGLLAIVLTCESKNYEKRSQKECVSRSIYRSINQPTNQPKHEKLGKLVPLEEFQSD